MLGIDIISFVGNMYLSNIKPLDVSKRRQPKKTQLFILAQDMHTTVFAIKNAGDRARYKN